jgi:hypothetical protein
MNRIRFASFFAALLAAVMLGGCAKTNEVASTEAAPAAGDAAPPEGETAATESATEPAEATEAAAPAEGEAPKN